MQVARTFLTVLLLVGSLAGAMRAIGAEETSPPSVTSHEVNVVRQVAIALAAGSDAIQDLRGGSFQRVRVLAVEHELISLVMHRRPRGYDARVSFQEPAGSACKRKKHVADVLRKERGTRSSKGEKLNCHFRSPYCKRTNRCPDQRQLLCRPMKSSDWAELLENSYIPLAKSKRGEDGQLPTGRQMLTCWHLELKRCPLYAQACSEPTLNRAARNPAASK